MKLSIAYFGTPYFSARFLEKILTDTTINQLIKVKLVITQPDRPVGKKQILTPSPVKEIAIKNNIFVATGGTAGRVPDDAQIGRYSPPVEHRREGKLGQNLLPHIDLALVCAYGQIIPRQLLTAPKYGFWNIHYSLLPKYRGPSPVAYSLMLGDKKTGVTIFQMDEKIDHGPIIAQEEIEILPTEKRSDLEKKLTDLAFDMFKKILKGENTLFERLKEQNHSLATYTKKLTKQDGFIEISKLKSQISNSPEKVYNLFRGLYPWPGLWTLLPNSKRLKLTNVELKDKKLVIKKVQLEGKKEVDFETFNKAYKIFKKAKIPVLSF